MKGLMFATLLLCLWLSPGMALSEGEEGDRGFLDRPPVYIDNEPDIPLALMGTQIPEPGQTIPGYDSLTMSSKEFRRDGVNVQPGLAVRFDVRRISALHGVKPGWGAALSIPWQHTRVEGTLGGLPATRDLTDWGDVSFFAKRHVWQGPNTSFVSIVGGLELPTGNSTVEFEQSNAATNGYFGDNTRRLPLGWTPGGGTVNGFLGAAYSTARGRLAYSAIIATKLHSSDDQDVKIGDVFCGALCGTYGLAKNAALSLSMIMRLQADDSYPLAPPPGVDGPLLNGTTNHGFTMYLDPSIRFKIADLIVIGAGVRYPVINPEDGFVPGVRGSIIIYPSL